ncbi:MAG: hypothetical protein JF886_03245 [Candidatus Dormibacteraeota bacterium]|uniref:Uncharacterized protein n=1 Tax=Candidatus Aeolococcus gillhamiae TaxID=3127015 RepID=A0A934N533_9BACT|nr:hypothetical protein [Candidatus Dormibacteraeota bacterium]
MARPLTVASVAWSVAIASAITGLLLPSPQERVSLGLFAFAVAVGLSVAIVLIADGLRHRARHGAGVAGAQSPLGRLEYLPAVTTRTKLIRWRGGRSRVARRRTGTNAPGSLHLTGSAYPPRASSTRQPRTDAVEASPRAS